MGTVPWFQQRGVPSFPRSIDRMGYRQPNPFFIPDLNRRLWGNIALALWDFSPISSSHILKVISTIPITDIRIVRIHPIKIFPIPARQHGLLHGKRAFRRITARPDKSGLEQPLPAKSQFPIPTRRKHVKAAVFPLNHTAAPDHKILFVKSSILFCWENPFCYPVSYHLSSPHPFCYPIIYA